MDKQSVFFRIKRLFVGFYLESTLLIYDKIDFVFILCSPESDIVRLVILGKILEYEIFQKRSLIESLVKAFKIIYEIISESRIVEVYFWHFCELFSYVGEKWLDCNDMIGFPHDVDVILHGRYGEIDCIGDFMKIQEIPYLICKDLEEKKILLLILDLRFKNILFNIAQSQLFQTFFLFLYSRSKNHIGISSVYHKLMVEREYLLFMEKRYIPYSLLQCLTKPIMPSEVKEFIEIQRVHLQKNLSPSEGILKILVYIKRRTSRNDEFNLSFVFIIQIFEKIGRVLEILYLIDKNIFLTVCLADKIKEICRTLIKAFQKLPSFQIKEKNLFSLFLHILADLPEYGRLPNLTRSQNENDSVILHIVCNLGFYIS